MKGIYTFAENLDGPGVMVLWMLPDGEHQALHLAANEAEAKRVCETLRAAFPDGPGGGGQVDNVHQDIEPSGNGHDEFHDPESGIDLLAGEPVNPKRCAGCGRYCSPGLDTCDHPDCRGRKKPGTGKGGAS